MNTADQFLPKNSAVIWSFVKITFFYFAVSTNLL